MKTNFFKNFNFEIYDYKVKMIKTDVNNKNVLTRACNDSQKFIYFDYLCNRNIQYSRIVYVKFFTPNFIKNNFELIQSYYFPRFINTISKYYNH